MVGRGGGVWAKSPVAFHFGGHTLAWPSAFASPGLACGLAYPGLAFGLMVCTAGDGLHSGGGSA